MAERARTRLAAALALLGLAFGAGAAECPGAAAWCAHYADGAPGWRLAGGAARRAGEHLLLPAGASALLPADTAAVTPADHYMEARVRGGAGAGATVQRAVLVLRHADARNWVGAAINLTPGSPRMTVDLVQMHEGRLSRLRSLGHDAAPAASFQTLRVALSGAELSAWLDGERIAATLPTPAPPAGDDGILAQDGAVEVDDVRIGATGTLPGRAALARTVSRIGLQLGDVGRYPVSAFGGDGVTPLAIGASSSDPALAEARIEGRTLVVTARRAGRATITVRSTLDGNVASAIAVKVDAAFTAPGRHLPRRLDPAAGTPGVPIDTLLRLRFDSAPALGTGGSIRIQRAADGALVDLVRLDEDVDAIGYPGQALKRAVRRKPVRIEGTDAVIQPHSARLAYGTDYIVTVDAAAFKGSIDGKPYTGIGKAAGWRFRTRAQAPTGTALTVDDDGPADFRTVQGALNHVMQKLPREAPATIRVANGRYPELLYLRGKDNLTLRGESRDGVLIAAANDDGTNPGSGSGQAADSPGATGGRAVFLVEDADLLTLERLTLANTAQRAGSLGSQAEALHFNSERRLVARDASFLSEQDTIQVKGYAWFYRTLVAGNVDFIWGANHAALFEDSEIRSVGDSAHPDGGGYLVQARTLDARDPGFVFLNSRLTHGPGPAGNDVPSASTWLARPGTAASWDKVVFIGCRMDAHIAPGGWLLPKATAVAGRAGSGWMEARSMDPDGRPLDLSQRRGGRVLTAAEAARYGSRAQVFSHFDNGAGWNPAPDSE